MRQTTAPSVKRMLELWAEFWHKVQKLQAQGFTVWIAPEKLKKTNLR